MVGRFQTPEYKLEINCQYIIIRIYAPLCRPESMEVITEGRNVTYECFPYFLRVTLPKSFAKHVIERFYDELLGFYTVKFTRHQYNASEFNAVEVYNELLQSLEAGSRVGNQPVRPVPKVHYGFLNLYSERFGQYYMAFPDVIELTDPDNTKAVDRRSLRLQDEKQKWNEDHYLADFMENDYIIHLFDYTPPWKSQNGKIDLTEYEKNFLAKIRIYDCFQQGLPKYQRHFGELQLVDVLLAYCYNKRSTEGDNTVVSAWTINKLSSTLSWFEVFDSLNDVLLAFYKRSLTYPLYRNWEFTKKIHSDVSSLLRSGNVNLIRALIEIHELFDTTDNYYILNKLYINNMIHFCRRFPEERIKELATKIDSILINKMEIHEDLINLERMALVVAAEEENKTLLSSKELLVTNNQNKEEESNSDSISKILSIS